MLLWIKAAHIISFVAWFAGLFYLPRLFVYHANTPVGSPQSETFKIMERRLLRAITTPAMVATWIFGLWVAFLGGYWDQGWLHIKLLLVLILSGYHGYLVTRWKKFDRDNNHHSARFYRILNEVPTVLLILIVILAVVKPV